MSDKIHNAERSKVSTVGLFVGIYLMTATCAVPYIWGNLNVYTVSYYHFRVNIDMGNASSWILALNSMCWGIGILTGSYAWKLLGFRVAMIGSHIVLSASMSLGFFAQKTSYILLKVLLGVVCGLTFGLIQCFETTLILKWVDPKRLGLAICSVMVVQQIGMIGMSLILTKYVNPGNIRPDMKASTLRLFSRREVLDNVPYMFIVFGCITFGLGLISSLLVWTKTPKRDEKRNSKSECQPNYGPLGEKCEDFRKKSYNSTKGIEHLCKGTTWSKASKQLNTERMTTLSKKPSTCFQNCSERCESNAEKERDESFENIASSTDACRDQPDNPVHERESTLSNSRVVAAAQSSDRVVKKLHEGGDIKSEGSTSEFSVKEILRSKNFYIMLMMSTYADVTCTILNTYYKMFGLVHNPDDDFFTFMGVWMNVGTIIATCLSGLACDRWHVKDVVVANTAILCLSSTFFYIAALVNKWLFLVLGAIYIGCGLSVYILVTVCASRYFDKRHTTTILGMAQISVYLTNTLLPIATNYVLSTWGWLHLFTMVSLTILLGLFAVVIGLGRTSHTDARSIKTN